MKVENPAIPPGSIIVVLGANGYIAQKTCHKLLEAGYRVRGAVRDIVRNAWAHGLFDNKFPGMFELVEVVDFGAEGAFDEAFKGAAGVIYVSVPVVFSPDPTVAAGITRFVLNPSSKVVETTVYNTLHTIKNDTYNNAEVTKALNEPTVPTPERALTVYSARRTSAELAFWDWARESYLIDTQDTARLLVAALVLPNISNERIFAFYKHYTWNELRQRVRDLYPDRDDVVLGEDYDDLGDMGHADKLISRAEEILRQIGQMGFSSVDDLLKDFIESFYLKTL
ncbi:NAD(P)-binding protein [Aspergillus venezuelensis]